MINCYFVRYLGNRNIALSFPYRPSVRFKTKASAFFLISYECSIQTLNSVSFKTNMFILLCFKWLFGVLEKPRFTGGDLWTQRASSGPTHTRTEGRAPVWGSEFTSKAAKRLDLIQTQVAKRRMQRVEAYASALRLSQHVKWAKVGAA